MSGSGIRRESPIGACGDMPEEERNAVATAARACSRAYLKAASAKLSDDAKGSHDSKLATFLDGLTNALITGLNDKALADELDWPIQPPSISESEVREVCKLAASVVRKQAYGLRLSALRGAIVHAMRAGQIREIAETYFIEHGSQILAEVLTLVQEASDEASSGSRGNQSRYQLPTSANLPAESETRAKKRLFYESVVEKMEKMKSEDESFGRKPLATRLGEIYKIDRHGSPSSEAFVRKFKRLHEKLGEHQTGQQDTSPPKRKNSARDEEQTTANDGEIEHSVAGTRMACDVLVNGFAKPPQNEPAVKRGKIETVQGQNVTRRRWDEDEDKEMQEIMGSDDYQAERTLLQRAKFVHRHFEKLYPGKRTEQAIVNRLRKLEQEKTPESENMDVECTAESEETGADEKSHDDKEHCSAYEEEDEEEDEEDAADDDFEVSRGRRRASRSTERGARVGGVGGEDVECLPAVEASAFSIDADRARFKEGTLKAEVFKPPQNEPAVKRGKIETVQGQNVTRRRNPPKPKTQNLKPKPKPKTQNPKLYSDSWLSLFKIDIVEGQIVKRRRWDDLWSSYEDKAMQEIMGSDDYQAERTLLQRAKFVHRHFEKRYPGEKTEQAIVNRLRKLEQEKTPESENMDVECTAESEETDADEKSHDDKEHCSAYEEEDEEDAADDGEKDEVDDEDEDVNEEEEKDAKRRTEPQTRTEAVTDERRIGDGRLGPRGFKEDDTVYVRGVCNLFHGGKERLNGYRLETSFLPGYVTPRRLKHGNFSAPAKWKGVVTGYSSTRNEYEVCVDGYYLVGNDGKRWFKSDDIFCSEDVDVSELKKLYATHVKQGKRNVVFEKTLDMDATELGHKPTKYDVYYAPLFVEGSAETDEPTKYFHSLCGVCNMDMPDCFDEPMVCDNECGAHAHAECLGLAEGLPSGDWFCPPCELSKSIKPKCVVCATSDGYLANSPEIGSSTPDSNNKGGTFVHPACARMYCDIFDFVSTEVIGSSSDSSFFEHRFFHDAKRLSLIKEKENALECELCHRREGIVASCDNVKGAKEKCGRKFHAMCAINRKDYLVSQAREHRRDSERYGAITCRCSGCFENPFVEGNL